LFAAGLIIFLLRRVDLPQETTVGFWIFEVMVIALFLFAISFLRNAFRSKGEMSAFSQIAYQMTSTTILAALAVACQLVVLWLLAFMAG
jgi:hypothetical protein